MTREFAEWSQHDAGATQPPKACQFKPGDFVACVEEKSTLNALLKQVGLELITIMPRLQIDSLNEENIAISNYNKWKTFGYKRKTRR